MKTGATIGGSWARPAAVLAIVLLHGCGGSTPTGPAVPAPAAAPIQPLSDSATYALTFAASADCNRDWWTPGFVPSRTYQTVINRRSSSWQLLSLTGATFAPSTNGYPGTDWNVISFSSAGGVVEMYFEDPPIQEVTPSGSALLFIYGHAKGAITDPLSELTFDGEFAGCTAANHRLTIQRVSA